MDRGGFCVSFIDLTIPMESGRIESCPGEPTGYFMPYANIAEHGWASHQILLYTHGGTHMDAPSHFIAGGLDVASLPLEAMIGPAIVADVVIGDDETFGPDNVKFPREPQAGDRVLFRTGWERHRGSSDYFTRSPHFGLDLAEYLVRQEVQLIGIDLPTPNRRHPHDIHQIILGAGVILIEALTNLAAIPAPFGTVACVPLPLAGLDGSPVRAVWITNEH